MDESWVLVDENTGLHVAWYFWLRVLDEANRSARYGHPFGLLLLEAELMRGASARLAEEASSHVPAVVRGTDLGGLLGVGRVGVVLPHQDVTAAESGMQRILAQLERMAPTGVRWGGRLLCYPGDGAEISNLISTGWKTERRAEEPELESTG